MQQLLTAAASARLERLELGCCGRGFTDAAARALAAAAPGGRLPALRSLELYGAYNLTDSALSDLIAAAPGLVKLALPQASKLDGSLVSRLPGLLPKLEELDLGECRGVPGEVLAEALPRMAALRRLSLDGIPEVSWFQGSPACLRLVLYAKSMSRGRCPRRRCRVCCPNHRSWVWGSAGACLVRGWRRRQRCGA